MGMIISFSNANKTFKTIILFDFWRDLPEVHDPCVRAISEL